MFPKATYVDRRKTLQGRFENGLLLLLGNNESPMNYADNCFPFRQDSTFLYYFGIDQPELAAVIDVDEGSTTIFGDELTIDHIVWMGYLPTIAERAEEVVAFTSPSCHRVAKTATTLRARRMRTGNPTHRRLQRPRVQPVGPAPPHPPPPPWKSHGSRTVPHRRGCYGAVLLHTCL